MVPSLYHAELAGSKPVGLAVSRVFGEDSQGEEMRLDARQGAPQAGAAWAVSLLDGWIPLGIRRQRLLRRSSE